MEHIPINDPTDRPLMDLLRDQTAQYLQAHIAEFLKRGEHMLICLPESGPDSLREKLDPEGYIRERYEATCRESDILPGQNEQEIRMKEMVNLNFRYFMQTLLERKDRMSMYHSLEVRVPFCDYRIAEYLYGVPWEYKDYQGREKGLLREAVKDLLPEQIVNRKKSPYPKTFDPRYEQIVVSLLKQRMEEQSPLWEIIRKDGLLQLLEGNSPWPWYGQLMRRPQTIAYFLQMDFWLKHYRVKLRF